MSNRIIIRNDDVLLSSTAHYENSFERFKYVHELTQISSRLVHVPAIVTEEIRAFPEAIEYIQAETKAKRMTPQLHGLLHVDYGKLSRLVIIAHLEESIEWFITTLGYSPTIWYTPWGANQPHLHEVAEILSLKVIDCSNTIKFKGRYGVTQVLKEGRPLSFFYGSEIIMHWWNDLDVERLKFFANLLKEDETSNNN